MTCARTYLEIHHPENAKWVSALVLLSAMNIVWPYVFLSKGATFGQFFKVNLLLILLGRAPIALMYTLALAGKWKVEGTENYVRYVMQLTDPHGPNIPIDANPALANRKAPSA